MRKILSIDKSENYTICLFEHRLFEKCDHYLEFTEKLFHERVV